MLIRSSRLFPRLQTACLRAVPHVQKLSTAVRKLSTAVRVEDDEQSGVKQLYAGVGNATHPELIREFRPMPTPDCRVPGSTCHTQMLLTGLSLPEGDVHLSVAAVNGVCELEVAQAARAVRQLRAWRWKGLRECIVDWETSRQELGYLNLTGYTPKEHMELAPLVSRPRVNAASLVKFFKGRWMAWQQEERESEEVAGHLLVWAAS